MMRAPFHVLFACTGNATRSIFAEAILNRDSAGEVKAFSAGLTPAKVVDPQAIALLRRLDMPIRGLRAKSWREYTRADASAWMP
jgi:arsenate reductase